MYARIAVYNQKTHTAKAIENGPSSILDRGMTEYASEYDHLMIIPFSVGNQGQGPWTFQAYAED